MMDRDNITRTGAKDPWGRGAKASRTAACRGAEDLDSEPGHSPLPKRAKGGGKLLGCEGMPGAGLTESPYRKALPDMLALKPCWGKPAARDFRGDDGNVGIIRSPVRAIVLPDQQGVLDVRYSPANGGCA